MSFWGDDATLICDVSDAIKMSTYSHGETTGVDTVALFENLDDIGLMIVHKK
jgi:hypothetical protein